MKYYYIKDEDTVGKVVDDKYYIFDINGWRSDVLNVIRDRLMGYDETEPDDSPYKIGNESIMDLIEEISEEEAEKKAEEIKEREQNKPIVTDRPRMTEDEVRRRLSQRAAEYFMFMDDDDEVE